MRMWCLFFCLCGGSVLATEVAALEDKNIFVDILIKSAQTETDLDKFRVSINQYLSLVETKEGIEKWNKKLDERVKEATQSDVSEQNYMNSYVQDWFISKNKEFEAKDKKTIKEACLLIKRIFDRELGFPSKVKEYIDSNCKKLIADLESLKAEHQTKNSK